MYVGVCVEHVFVGVYYYEHRCPWRKNRPDLYIIRVAGFGRHRTLERY